MVHNLSISRTGVILKTEPNGPLFVGSLGGSFSITVKSTGRIETVDGRIRIECWCELVG